MSVGRRGLLIYGARTFACEMDDGQRYAWLVRFAVATVADGGDTLAPLPAGQSTPYR
jgi:hypothetical protein